MEPVHSNNIDLKKDETILFTSKISKNALLVTWLAIPGVVLIPYIITNIPKIISYFIKKVIKELLFGEEQVLQKAPELLDFLPDDVKNVLLVLISIPLTLLFLAWLGYNLVMTKHHFQNHIVVTNLRVVGSSAKTNIDAELSQIKNVILEQSLFGRLFNYGNVVITSKRQSITIKNLDNPRALYKLLLPYAENYCAN